MMERNELEHILLGELKRVEAPAGLWGRVESAVNRPVRPASRRLSWVLAGMVSVAAALALFLQSPLNRPSEMAMDIQPFLNPMKSLPAVLQPADSPEFAAGYRVASNCVTAVHGEAVRQVVLTSPKNDVSLFIASPKVRLRVGDERWMDQNVGGVAVKRINCPRVRSVQFPCSKQVCVIACKRCSEDAILALMTRVAAQPPDLVN
jgi:hypothetical protein